MPRAPSVALLAALGLAVAACAGADVPDPKSAAEAFGRATAKGDADAVYALMSDAAKNERTRDEVGAIVKDLRDELQQKGAAVSAKDARVEATARLRFADGEEAALDLERGRFYVTSAGALPGGARTTEEALDQLRRVLARRSYAGLMRVLSPATRAAIEQDVRSLVVGLDRADSLPVTLAGDAATVAVPGGHHVRLKREAGVWRVEDFD
jgi:hypothetical protein